MKFHTITNIFPMMAEEEFKDLVEDIRKHGLREPIWIWKGEIVDGRNRYLACEKAGVEPQFREWDGEGSLVEFVVSLNLHRRHLSQSQKAMISENMLPFLEEEAKWRSPTTVVVGFFVPGSLSRLALILLPKQEHRVEVFSPQA